MRMKIDRHTNAVQAPETIMLNFLNDRLLINGSGASAVLLSVMFLESWLIQTCLLPTGLAWDRYDWSRC
jgi:hypothetical protein